MVLRALLLTWIAAVQAGASHDSADNASIQIRVFDYTSLPASELRNAGAVTARLLRRANIQSDWIVCRPATDATPSDCESAPGPNDFVLRIINKGANAATGELGFIYFNEQDSCYLAVSRETADDIAAFGIASRAQVLAHATVHELGHALLGARSHSQSGVMKAVVERRDLAEIAAERLRFTREQSERLRMRISDRLARRRNSDLVQVAKKRD